MYYIEYTIYIEAVLAKDLIMIHFVEDQWCGAGGYYFIPKGLGTH